MVVSLRIACLLVVGMAVLGCEDKGAPGKGGPAASSEVSSVIPGASTAPTPTAPSASASAPVAAPAAVPDAITAQHVLVAYKGAERAPKSVTRSKADAKKRAEEVAAKAKSGADFSALVEEYSDDPAAKERRGSLGKFTRGKMAKPFSDAAFALGVDETSPPVETPFGYHVIKRNQ
jgi:hypothetical protein